MPFARAPGRVNLIGDHTDYQDGWCMPMAIDREVVARFTARADGRVVVRSRDLPGAVDLAADGSAEPAQVEPEWGRTVAAVLRVLAARGRRGVGFDAGVTSTVPLGAGLSSSAAFGVAIALAATRVADLHIAASELACCARDAEQLASGVPCGVMDQMASVHGRHDAALLLDCRSLEHRAVPLPASVGVVVVHSGVVRRLAESGYAQRRAACEAAATRLGVRALRDARPEQVRDDPLARHVVSENGRVLAFADALARGDAEECGRLMLASHASLRDDFAVSTPELDILVELACDAGALGARLTGAGFGGCIVALAPAGRVDAVTRELTARYRARTGLVADAFAVRAAAGAEVVDTADGEEL